MAIIWGGGDRETALTRMLWWLLRVANIGLLLAYTILIVAGCVIDHHTANAWLAGWRR